MIIRKMAGVAVAALILTGCAATHFTATKDDMSSFPRDNTDCRFMTRELWVAPLIAAPIAAYAAQKRAEQNFKACMEARGYTMQAVEQ